ncbi:MAG TPA: substrate-binding domain-containing protein, partial [Ilumatobacteraceae bacterium]
GLMTPDVTDPIHGQVVTGFQQRAAERGYSVILSNGLRDADTERQALREFAAHRVAGCAVMGGVLSQAETKRLLSPSPVLFIDSDHVPPTGSALDLPRGCIRPDDRDGMLQVVDHLIERRYRTVAYVSGSSGANQIIRRDALVSALAQRGMAEPVVLSADDDGSRGLRTVAAQIRKRRPDAVVCYDDETALILMDELRAAGVHVPDGVGIVGFDDIPFARISNPRLTTVTQRSDDLGRASVEFLLSALEGGKLPESRLMPVTLVVRETTPGRVERPSKPKKGRP